MSYKTDIRDRFNSQCGKRDHYRCVICRTQIGRTVTHHIIDRHYMPNGGYVLQNGITLCDECHWKAEKFHRTEGREWEKGYHPNDLYAKIGSSFNMAVEASERL